MGTTWSSGLSSGIRASFGTLDQYGLVSGGSVGIEFLKMTRTITQGAENDRA